MKKMLVVLLGLTCTTMVAADVLWDQSSPLAPYWQQPPMLTHQEFPPPDPFGNYSSYVVSDVDTGGSAWQIQKVTVYFTKYTGASPSPWENVVTQARLNILPLTGALPNNGDDPRNGQLVPVTVTSFTQGNDYYLAIAAQGLNIPLPAGAYWVGLTPLAPLASIGYYQEVHAQTTMRGVESAWRNPAGAFGNGPNWMPWSVPGSDWLINTDASMTIEGVPEPGALALLALGAAGLLRRR